MTTEEKKPKCNPRNYSYFLRDTGYYLGVCGACGKTEERLTLPPGWKKSGHGFRFSAPELEKQMLETQTAAEPPIS